MTRPHRLRVLTFATRGIGAALAAVLLLGGVEYHEGNLHEVDPGRLYRSRQLDELQLRDVITRHHIRSVLNLRGANPGQPWYDTEMRVSAAAAVTHYDVELSAREYVDDQRMLALREILRKAPKPLLVHCNGGSDRTGLVSALYEFDRGASAQTAARQLSIVYGHFPWLGSKTAAMDSSFAGYVMRHSHSSQE